MARSLLLRVRMGPFSFHIKRSHLAITAFGRKIFSEDSRRVGKRVRETVRLLIEAMTPARFDFLHALVEKCASSQKRMREALGLHHSTISKMVARLTELGFIEAATTTPWDRRTHPFSITRAGLRAYRRSRHLLFRRKVIEKVFHKVIGGAQGRLAAWHNLNERTDFIEKMQYVADHFRKIWFPPHRQSQAECSDLYPILTTAADERLIEAASKRRTRGMTRPAHWPSVAVCRAETAADIRANLGLHVSLHA